MSRNFRSLPDGPATQMLVLIGTAVTVGALASLLAIGLLDIVAWLNALLLVDPRSRVQWEQFPWVVTAATLLVPAVGGLCVGLAHRYLAPAGRPLGPPDVIHAVQFRAALPDARSGLVSTATAAVSLGVGASVGQYGPMVYLGAMIGGMVRRFDPIVPNIAAIAMSCGVAAAISTAFNAPIAGLVFAHEVVLRHYATRAFAPVTVASATGYVIANVFLERPALFLVQFAGVAHGYEFLLFAALGMMVAVMAVGYMRLLLHSGPWLARVVARPEWRPAAAGLVLGMTALYLPDVLGIGTETLRFATIEGAFGRGELLVLILAKIAVTALCIGAGFSGGVFSPALLIGSLIGALFWMLLSGVAGVPTSGVAVYAICGMMAFASAVIGAPLTCILIVFELTRSYDLTIASMVGVVFSNLISHRVFGRSYFDVQLARRGVNLSLGRDRALLSAMPVLDLVSDDAVTALRHETPDAVAARLAAQGWREAFVTSEDGSFVGIFTFGDRAGAATVGAAVTQPRLTFDEETNIADAMDLLRGFVGDAVPVVAKGTGRYLGAVAEADVVAAWLDMSAHLRREENASI